MEPGNEGGNERTVTTADVRELRAAARDVISGLEGSGVLQDVQVSNAGGFVEERFREFFAGLSACSRVKASVVALYGPLDLCPVELALLVQMVQTAVVADQALDLNEGVFSRRPAVHSPLFADLHEKCHGLIRSAAEEAPPVKPWVMAALRHLREDLYIATVSAPLVRDRQSPLRAFLFTRCSNDVDVVVPVVQDAQGVDTHEALKFVKHTEGVMEEMDFPHQKELREVEFAGSSEDLLEALSSGEERTRSIHSSVSALVCLAKGDFHGFRAHLLQVFLLWHVSRLTDDEIRTVHGARRTLQKLRIKHEEPPRTTDADMWATALRFPRNLAVHNESPDTSLVCCNFLYDSGIGSALYKTVVDRRVAALF